MHPSKLDNKVNQDNIFLNTLIYKHLFKGSSYLLQGHFNYFQF